MRQDSMVLENELAMRGHPNLFQSTPVVTSKEWDILQTLSVHTLLYTQVLTGTGDRWRTAVAHVTADVETWSELLHNLDTVDRNVAPTTHATCLLMPTQQFLRKIIGEVLPDATREELMAYMKASADIFTSFVIQGELQDPPPRSASSEWNLDDALGLVEAFHVLEALPSRWSPYHLFKCNCPDFFKNASCIHSILASMLCDRNIKVPSRYLSTKIQQRRRRGRPSSKGAEVGDVAEVKARERIQLQTMYQLPKVSVHRMMQECHCIC